MVNFTHALNSAPAQLLQCQKGEFHLEKVIYGKDISPHQVTTEDKTVAEKRKIKLTLPPISSLRIY